MNVQLECFDVLYSIVLYCYHFLKLVDHTKCLTVLINKLFLLMTAIFLDMKTEVGIMPSVLTTWQKSFLISFRCVYSQPQYSLPLSTTWSVSICNCVLFNTFIGTFTYPPVYVYGVKAHNYTYSQNVEHYYAHVVVLQGSGMVLVISSSSCSPWCQSPLLDLLKFTVLGASLRTTV